MASGRRGHTTQHTQHTAGESARARALVAHPGANATPRRRGSRKWPARMPHPGVALRAYCRCSEQGRVALRVLGLLATVIAARSKQAERATKKRHAHDKNETRQRRGGDRECDERRSCAARSTHARRTSRLPEADPRARLACRERGGGVAASALVERSGAKRSDDRNVTPPRAKTHIPRTVHDLLDCGGDNHRGDSHEATTCRRRCAPWLHAEPPTRKRSWHLAARSSPSSHPGNSHRRRPRQPARVLAPAPRGRSSPEPETAAQELVIVTMTHGRKSYHT